jgi:hypothetical protein
MKITVDLSALFACVEEMGATIVKNSVIAPPKASKGLDRPEWVPIKKEIDLKDIGSTQGVLSFIDERGIAQQVLLYIQDHGGSIEAAIHDIEKRRKFHVADCSTLQKKRADGTFERYVMTNDLSNQFLITGTDWRTRRSRSESVELQVCKNCLKRLNYKDYSRNYEAFTEFSIAEFFTTYSSFFTSLPSRFVGDEDGSYNDDWAMISAKYRASKNYLCESCGVDLSKYKHLLHTHHKSGVKSNNRPSNLQALCIDCHRKQTNHEHLFVHHQDMVLINRLRREQKKFESVRWREVYEFADPALHGLLAQCQHSGIKEPIIAYELLGDFDQIIAELDIAWPKSKTCIVIREDDAEVAHSQKWKVWTMIQAMEHFSEFSRSIW